MYIFIHFVPAHCPYGCLAFFFCLSGSFETLEDLLVGLLEVYDCGMCSISVELSLLAFYITVKEWLMLITVISHSHSSRWFMPYKFVLYLESISFYGVPEYYLCLIRVEYIHSGSILNMFSVSLEDFIEELIEVFV